MLALMNTLDSKTIRYRNAKHLREKAGGVTGFANKIGRTQAQASAIAGDNPIKGIGPKMARHIEEIFYLPSGWLDVPHPEHWGAEGHQTEDPSPSEETHVIIPRYNIKAACGNGFLNDHVEVKGGLAFMRSWLRDMGWKAADLVVVYASKDSMWPTITDGAVLLVDTSQLTPESGKVYLINWFGEERIKRLFRESETVFRVSSDNPNKTEYPDERVDFSTQHGAHIIGRVVWQGGTL